jgi:ElaB/YqjD/DUF883 family membrane-anchored ribosome-binding protein
MSDIKNKMEDGKKKAEGTVKAAARAAAESAEAGVESATQTASDAWEATKDAGHRASEFASEQYGRLGRGARDAYQHGRQSAMDLEHNFEGHIRRKPLTAVLIGAAVGFILGLAMCRKR